MADRPAAVSPLDALRAEMHRAIDEAVGYERYAAARAGYAHQHGVIRARMLAIVDRAVALGRRLACEAEDDETGPLSGDVAREVLCRVFEDGADEGIQEWHEWYQPDQWLWFARGLGAFIHKRLIAKRELTSDQRDAIDRAWSTHRPGDSTVTLATRDLNLLLSAIATPVYLPARSDAPR